MVHLLRYLFGLKVLNISIALGQARIATIINSQCYNLTTNKEDYNTWLWNLSGSPYKFNSEKNKFVVIGCETLAYVNFHIDQNTYWGSCGSWCYSLESLVNGSCSGIGCCQIVFPKGTNCFSVSFDARCNNSLTRKFSHCGYAMLIEVAEFTFNTSYITTDELESKNRPVVIDWVIENTTCDTAQANKSSYACKSKYSSCSNSSSKMG